MDNNFKNALKIDTLNTNNTSSNKSNKTNLLLSKLSLLNNYRQNLKYVV